jgi:hypothetical protein
MLLSTDTYEDAQIQNSAPIGPQPPIPSGVHDIELSWDRKRGYMRVVIDDSTWWFKEYLGKAQMMGTDNARGRLFLRAMARIDGDTLSMFRDPDSEPHAEVEGLRREPTHNRLCYRRSSEDWRLRDERMGWNHPDALVYVKSYVGDMNAEWNRQDTVAHIFHNGYVIIDSDDVAHLYDPSL